MKALVFAAVLALTATAQAKNCNPAKSKPCGNGCISKALTCHKTSTSSVSKAPAVTPVKAPKK